MKEFRLSTPGERAAGISFSVCAIVCFGILLYALRSNTALMIVCGLGALLISALLVYYIISAVKGVCIVDREAKTVEVKGATHYTVDVSKAVLLQTLPRKNGQTTIRVLVFSDAEEQIVATIPTMFTYRQGILADPMAKDMAKELGIGFKQNVQDWELDKKKYQEHQKEVAEQERREAKEKRQKRMEMRIQKYKQNK